MTICGIKQTLPGVLECTPDAGSAFFLRTAYLKIVPAEKLSPFEQKPFEEDSVPECISFNEEESEDIFNAALIFSAEKMAMTYLARAEQCRAGLTKKLLAKGIDKNVISEALDYLESIKYLDDTRFAGAWLRNRSIDHAEGRIKLNAELSSRGVDRHAVKAALDEFFENHDEIELCRRAYQHLLRIKTKPEKIALSLERNGFTYSEIKLVLQENCDK